MNGRKTVKLGGQLDEKQGVSSYLKWSLELVISYILTFRFLSFTVYFVNAPISAWHLVNAQSMTAIVIIIVIFIWIEESDPDNISKYENLEMGSCIAFQT